MKIVAVYILFDIFHFYERFFMVDTSKILKGYVKNKKILQSPFNHSLPLRMVSTVDHLLCVIWIALLLHNNGFSKQTTNLIIKIVKFGADNTKGNNCFLFCHNFLELSEKNKSDMLSSLSSDEKNIINRAFAEFAFFYRDFPLAFMVSQECVSKVQQSSINMIKNVFDKLSSRFSELSTFTMATTVISAMVQDKLFFAQDLMPDFKSLEFYPDTAESKRAAAFVRTTFNALFTPQDDILLKEWIAYVWATGEQFACEPNDKQALFLPYTAGELEHDWK